MTYFVELPPIVAEFERWEYVNYRSKLPLIGIYEIVNEFGQTLYVGKSTNLPNRVSSHIRSSEFAHEINRIKVRKVDDLQALDIYETHAINVTRPIYNRDKVYRPSEEQLAQRKYDYTVACDDFERCRDLVDYLLEETPCTLRDIDLEIAREALVEAKHRRSYLRSKLAKKVVKKP